MSPVSPDYFNCGTGYGALVESRPCGEQSYPAASLAARGRAGLCAAGFRRIRAIVSNWRTASWKRAA